MKDVGGPTAEYLRGYRRPLTSRLVPTTRIRFGDLHAVRMTCIAVRECGILQIVGRGMSIAKYHRSTQADATGVTGSYWAPLGHPFFASLWIATLISNMGSWAQDLASSWLMLTLAPGNALRIGVLQAAAALPTFLFVLPAGVLADIFDRRRLLVWAQLAMIATAGMLAALTALGMTSPNILLFFTFAMSGGAALGAPASQAWQSELVPQAEMPTAVALSSLAVNAARALGPVVGGLAVSLAGPAAAFALNALSTGAVLAVLVVGRRAAPRPEPARLPPEHFFPALRAGMRYARNGVLLRRVLARGFLFFLPGSALWALLPLIARGSLRLDASGYGALLATMGLGAMVGAVALPSLRRNFGPDTATGIATAMFGVAFIGLGIAAVHGSVLLAYFALPLAGLAWIVMLAHFNVAAQRAVAGWVRARALALYLVTFSGATALGGALWGSVAELLTPSLALFVAAGLLIAGVAAVHRIPLIDSETSDLTKAAGFRDDAPDSSSDIGPVLVDIEYDVAPENEIAFVTAMQALRRTRLRTGAYAWVHLHDRDHPSLHREQFWLESWLDHLRQRRIHETVFDANLRRRVRSLVVPGTEPTVHHFVDESRRPNSHNNDWVNSVKTRFHDASDRAELLIFNPSPVVQLRRCAGLLLAL